MKDKYAVQKAKLSLFADSIQEQNNEPFISKRLVMGGMSSLFDVKCGF